jgi:hypothetical protein
LVESFIIKTKTEFMKKILVCTVLLMLTISSFSQNTNYGQTFTREEYLKKSRNQNTAAWILLGSGVALAGAGIITGNQNEVSFENAATGVVLACIGVLSVAGSITLFSASGRNKRKALNASAWFNIPSYPFDRHTGVSFRSSPALLVKIKF